MREGIITQTQNNSRFSDSALLGYEFTMEGKLAKKKVLTGHCSLKSKSTGQRNLGEGSWFYLFKTLNKDLRCLIDCLYSSEHKASEKLHFYTESRRRCLRHT